MGVGRGESAIGACRVQAGSSCMPPSVGQRVTVSCKDTCIVCSSVLIVHI